MQTALPGQIKLLKHSFFFFFFLIQTALFGQQQENASGPLMEYSESFFSTMAKGLVLYKHRFEYNAAGKVAVDHFSYFINGKLRSNTRYEYRYDDAGRLAARVSSHNQNKFFYNPEGQLVKYEAHFLVEKKWQILEETSLTEMHAASGKGKTLHVVVNRKSPGGTTASVYHDLEYMQDAGGNFSQVRQHRYAGKPVNTSYVLTFDQHPNPLQHTFFSLRLDQVLENGGLHNLTGKSTGNSRQDITYTYNDSGYPVRAQVSNVKLIEFRYQNDPVQQPTNVLAALSAIDTTMASIAPEKQVSCRLSDYTESFQHPVLKNIAQYKHHFEYDKAGRPTSHTKTYFEGGKKIYFTTFHYQYNPAGKLVSKASRAQQQKFYYNQAGELSKIEVYQMRPDKNWALYIQDEYSSSMNTNQGKEVRQRYTAYYRNGTSNYQNEYVLDESGHIQKSITRRLESKTPVHLQNTPSTYTYDDKPNPLRNLYIRTAPNSYLEENTPHNIVREKYGSRESAVYRHEYNEYGYPVKVVSESLIIKDKAKTRRVEEYVYEIIKSAPTVLGMENDINMRLAPNPARTSVQLSVNNPGPGTVEIRILDIAGTRIFKNLTLPATDKLQTTLQVGDLPRGLYVVEVTTSKGVFARRLVLE